MKKLKEKLKYGKKGITLIALVITIIVLLILAGVSISTLIGDNSIIRKAVDSKSETEKATQNEKVELAVNSALMNNPTNLEITKTNLENAIREQFNTEDFEVIDNNNGTFTLIFNTGSKKNYEITNKGKISEYEEGVYTTDKLSNLVLSTTSANNIIGKKITNFEVDGVDGNWLIYYVGKNPEKANLSENHIYLVSEKILNYASLPTDNFTSSSPSPEYVSDLLSNIDLYPAATEWLGKYIEGKAKTNEENMKAILYLLDKSNWTTDKWLKKTLNNETINDYTNFVEYVIGSPTIEMFAASYNSINRDKKEMTIEASEKIGYATNATPKNWFEENTLWRSIDSNNQYWITSPYYLQRTN